MNRAEKQTGIAWGVLAQFAGSAELLEAIDRARAAGYTSLEAFTPIDVDGLPERLGLKRTPMPWIILVGGMLGGVSVYALAYWINLIAYPINVGGRPLHSWPAFIPPTFEGTVLGAAFFAICGVFFLCGLPRLHHPVFEIDAFKLASTDGYFLAIRSDQKEIDTSIVREQLQEFGAIQSWEVPNV
jgi:hypothetical protein